MKIKKASVHLHNKGFSLIELIVVIAVMAILVAVAVASSSIIESSYVKEVERGVEDYIGMTKSKSMSVSAKEWYMELTMEDGKYVTKMCRVDEVAAGDGIELKETVVDMESYNGKVDVIYRDGAGGTDINEISTLRMYFDAATGKIIRVTIGGAARDITDGIGRIAVESGTYDIVLKVYYNTGKCERE